MEQKYTVPWTTMRPPLLTVALMIVGCVFLFAGVNPASAQTISFETTPHLPSEDAAEIPAGNLYLYKPQATSSDGSAVQYSLRFGPSGMRVTAETGLIFWKSQEPGTVDVEIRAELVSDPGIFATQSWKIKVQPLGKHPGCTGNEGWISPGRGLPGSAGEAVVLGNELYVLHSPTSTRSNKMDLSKWNGRYWTKVGTLNHAVDSMVGATVYNGNIYVSGYWTPQPLYMWDGVEWSAVNTGQIQYVEALQVHDDKLFVIGYENGDRVLAAWDGTSWEVVQRFEGVYRQMYLAEYKSELYISGWQSPEKSTHVGKLVDGEIDPIIVSSGVVHSIVAYDDGLILFAEAGLIRWYNNQATILPSIPGLGNLSLFSVGGTLYALKWRTEYQPVPRKNFYDVWKYDGQKWIPISTLSAVEPPFYIDGKLIGYNGDLFAYGAITEACSNGLSNIAKICEDECGRITGTVYRDDDGDCEMGQNDEALSGETVKFKSGQYATTNSQGVYVAVLPAGNYTLGVSPRRYWQATCSESQDVTIASGSDVVSNVNFGLDMIPNIYDVRASVAAGIARPGRDLTYTIMYQNVGTEAATGTVAFEFDARLEFQNASVNPDRQNVGRLEWDFTNLAVGEKVSIQVTLKVPTTIQRGEELCASVEVKLEKPDDDQLLSDNVDEICVEVRTSYDPNDIRVFPHFELGEIGSETLRPEDSVLTYHVRFQNTGNDTAFTVVVKDTLAHQVLDIASIELGAASHPFTFSISGFGELTWTFDNILLPDSNVSEAGSHGYFKYKVHLKKGLAPMTEIPNRASIYFDYNAPVLTNAVVSVTSGTSSVSNSETVSNTLRVYPNPARGLASIQLKLAEREHVRLQLVNSKGVVVQTLMESELSAGEHNLKLEAGSLTPGAYFVALKRGEKNELFPIVVGQ